MSDLKKEIRFKTLPLLLKDMERYGKYQVLGTIKRHH